MLTLKIRRLNTKKEKLIKNALNYLNEAKSIKVAFS